MTNFYKILFFNLLITSTMISISAISWISAWIGLEVNLLALIPLMKSTSNKFSTEACIKYFIIQAMASACLLMSILLLSNLNLLNPKKIFILQIFMNSALVLKMGAAPLHFWLPEVVSGLNWNIILLILTWQKIAPMILLYYSLQSSTFLSIIVISSSLLSGLQGMNQMCLRKIMAFSSINHMSWMIASLLTSINLWTYYFTIYALTNFNIMFIFNKFNLLYINQLTKLFPENKILKFFLMTNFLSLGGIPPFLGFLPKWLTINFLVTSNFNLLSMIMVFLTLITLFIYLRISFAPFILNINESLVNPYSSNLHFFFVSLNVTIIMSLPLYFFISNLF
uniref:NADH-ubiquinone oxidoreductase chain 2 n=1 Tax=Trigonopterus porg TaxID=2678944 RepID=A0A7H1KI44_9CUCU|nr:NADH dehydrogenase subunit 2 [Trigonopterus porg]QNT26960.1 NADH dehydrogenase subunit 2 [Trigonopterus porg]